jgi:multiple sugar transport system ATP-binding protein
MSVHQNMAFGLKMRGTPRAEIERRVREAADILSIEQLLERRPRELSGGQRQRVALGRAIVREPKVFLFDEPLSNLDAKLRVQTRAEIARLHQRLKTTVVYVTHDQVEAMTLGQRIVLMDRGVVQQVDTPMNIYHRPANRFVGSFIGSPAMNFFPGRIAGQEFQLASGGTIPLASASSNGPLPSGAATLGVRPEDLVPQGNGLPLATVSLEVVEHMGHETMVHFTLSGADHIARLAPDTRAQPGDQLPLAIRPGAFHLFAGDDEARRLN